MTRPTLRSAFLFLSLCLPAAAGGPHPDTGDTEQREILAPWRQLNADGTPNPTGTPLVEQFRISGLSGDDYIEFIEAPYGAFGRLISPLDIGDLDARSDDYVGVIDGGPDDDTLIGTPSRDRIDGMSGSDTIFGLAGDDRVLLQHEGDQCGIGVDRQ